MSAARVIEVPDANGIVGIGKVLGRIFESVREAILAGEAVVLVVSSEDLLGHRGPESGALANAVVGLTRALAFEGAKATWDINVVAMPDALRSPGDRYFVPKGMSGQVLVHGTELVGRSPV